jgi:phage terminase large subunit
MAKNDVQVGIDRVKSYLKIHPKLKRPMLYIFDTCTNLLEEMTTYRYPELRPNQEGKRAENEKPVKVDDHALDALRYMIVDLPEPYVIDTKNDRFNKYKASEIGLQDEIEAAVSPKPKNIFGD